MTKTIATQQRFICVVTCGCGCQHFDRLMDDFYSTAILKCCNCGLEYRQPSVKYIPLLVR